MKKAIITDIKRFAVHDGPGIRTTVFFKGCPLRCLWCHNPETLYLKPQLAYYKHKCIDCGNCAKICPSGAHEFKKNKHNFFREKCTLKNECIKVCLSGALRVYGREIIKDELVALIKKDYAFYVESGGGVTLSGGECLLQADFCLELLKSLKEENIHTAIDTCGYVPVESINKVINYTDLFLYDIKALDEHLHKRCTGFGNQIILDNLRYIDEKNKKIEIRIPFIPNFNDGEIDKIGAFLSDFKNINKVRVLPYHNFASSKYDALGFFNTMPKICLPTVEQILQAVNLLKSHGLNAMTADT